jgi:hypothetical protein
MLRVSRDLIVQGWSLSEYLNLALIHALLILET